MYQLGLFGETLPMEDLSPEDVARARGAYGFTGLRFLQIAYGSDREERSLSDSKALISDLITSQIESLLAAASAATTKSSRPRRSSMLRRSGRRVSDAMSMEEFALCASHT